MTFIVLEGIDGAGKTTVAEALRDHFEDQGLDPLILREPGSTVLGERVRRVLLDPEVGELDPWTEACLFTACRVEMVKHQLRPALAAGRPVVLDRYYYSTVAYQSDTGTMDRAKMVVLNLAAVGGIQPGMVLLLDTPVGTALERRGIARDRIESKGYAYLETVRQSYLRQAAEDSQRWYVIDATKSQADVVRAATLLADKCDKHTGAEE